MSVKRYTIRKADKIRLKRTSIKGEIAPPFSFDELAEAYKLNTYHQRCINIKSQITAGYGFTTNETITEEIKRFINSGLIEELKKIQVDYEIFGNAFIELNKNIKGKVAEIKHLPALNCRLANNDENTLIYSGDNERFEYKRYGTSEEENLFWHIKNYDPNQKYYGIPEYISAIQQMLLERVATEYNVNRINNRSIPENVILITGAELNQQQQDDIAGFFEENYQGPENAGKVMIIQHKNKDANIQIKEVKGQLLDSVFRYMRKESRDEILSIHGVPPRIAGVVNSNQLGGVGEVKEQNRIFKELIIRVRQNILESIINTIIEKEYQKSIEFKLNNYDISDDLDDAKRIEILLKNQIITKEEAKKMIKLSEG